MNEVLAKLALVTGGVGYMAEALREFAAYSRKNSGRIAVHMGVTVEELEEKILEVEQQAEVLALAQQIMMDPHVLMVTITKAATDSTPTVNTMTREKILA